MRNVFIAIGMMIFIIALPAALGTSGFAGLLRAEIKWLNGVIADLESGKLDCPTEAELRAIGAGWAGRATRRCGS